MVLYLEVMVASCLIDDINQFEERDMKNVGLRGSNLSGGQRARVALARCFNVL